jgi:hypothetical protein
MPFRRRSTAKSSPRQPGVLLLIAVLFANLLFSSGVHPAAASDPLTDAIEICSAQGGIRYVQADGSELPAQQPGHDHRGCPDCMTCLQGCNHVLAASPAVPAQSIDSAAASLGTFATDSGRLLQRTFPVRPPGQAPPLKRA